MATLTAIPHALDSAAPQVTMLPGSPAELLRHIQIDGYKQAQADQAQRVRGSFEVSPVPSELLQTCAASRWKTHPPVVLMPWARSTVSFLPSFVPVTP